MLQNDMFFSTDVETDGPLVGIHSMISIGSVAFDTNGQEISSFSMNIKELDGAVQDQNTMKWWSEQPEVWKSTRVDQKTATEVMRLFQTWVNGIAEPRNVRPIFLAYPIGFDYAFVRWYLLKFTGKDIFQLATVDIRSYAMRAVNCSYSDFSFKKLPERYMKNTNELSHFAIDDARIQGKIFMNMWLENQKYQLIK
jgi:hypothetical protein